jgi:hypothetical protein
MDNDHEVNPSTLLGKIVGDALGWSKVETVDEGDGTYTHHFNVGGSPPEGEIDRATIYPAPPWPGIVVPAINDLNIEVTIPRSMSYLPPIFDDTPRIDADPMEWLT